MWGVRIVGGRTLLSVRADQEYDRQRLTDLFDELSPRVFAYARRHCDSDTAQDVVSDTFLVAWRRLDDIPPNALPWLLVVARNTIANHRRFEARRDRLTNAAARIAHLAAPSDAAENQAIERATFLDALSALTSLEREALLLIAWDGLTGRDAALVAGCTQRAFEVRVSRARARLVRATSNSAADPPARERSRVSQGHFIQPTAIEEKS